MNRSFQLMHHCICTHDNTIVEGEEYLYREGRTLKRIVLEEVLEHEEWLRLRIRFSGTSRLVEISHKEVDFIYPGMWQIVNLEDKDTEGEENS